MRSRLRGHTTIRSAFDMALHDIAAQAARLPLYAFLGGGRRLFETDNTVGLDEPDRMAAPSAKGGASNDFVWLKPSRVVFAVPKRGLPAPHRTAEAVAPVADANSGGAR